MSRSRLDRDPTYTNQTPGYLAWANDIIDVIVFYQSCPLNLCVREPKSSFLCVFRYLQTKLSLKLSAQRIFHSPFIPSTWMEDQYWNLSTKPFSVFVAC